MGREGDNTTFERSVCLFQIYTDDIMMLTNSSVMLHIGTYGKVSSETLRLIYEMGRVQEIHPVRCNYEVNIAILINTNYKSSFLIFTYFFCLVSSNQRNFGMSSTRTECELRVKRFEQTSHIWRSEGCSSLAFSVTSGVHFIVFQIFSIALHLVIYA